MNVRSTPSKCSLLTTMLRAQSGSNNITIITWRVSYEKQQFIHLPVFFGRVRVAHILNFLYYVLSSVVCCRLRFPHKNDVRFVFTSSCLQEGSYLIYVICVCLRIVVSNICCVVFLFLFFFFDLRIICCQFLWIVPF